MAWNSVASVIKKVYCGAGYYDVCVNPLCGLLMKSNSEFFHSYFEKPLGSTSLKMVRRLTVGLHQRFMHQKKDISQFPLFSISLSSIRFSVGFFDTEILGAVLCWLLLSETFFLSISVNLSMSVQIYWSVYILTPCRLKNKSCSRYMNFWHVLKILNESIKYRKFLP